MSVLSLLSTQAGLEVCFCQPSSATGADPQDVCLEPTESSLHDFWYSSVPLMCCDVPDHIREGSSVREVEAEPDIYLGLQVDSSVLDPKVSWGLLMSVLIKENSQDTCAAVEPTHNLSGELVFWRNIQGVEDCAGIVIGVRVSSIDIVFMLGAWEGDIVLNRSRMVDNEGLVSEYSHTISWEGMDIEPSSDRSYTDELWLTQKPRSSSDGDANWKMDTSVK